MVNVRNVYEVNDCKQNYAATFELFNFQKCPQCPIRSIAIVTANEREVFNGNGIFSEVKLTISSKGDDVIGMFLRCKLYERFIEDVLL